MQFGITLILLGLLAAPSLLLSKKPNAKEILDKIAPYQGWIGMVFAFWGIFGIISMILTPAIFTVTPIWAATLLIATVLQTLLGFILGYTLINQYVLSKNETAKKKGEELLAKLTPIQAKIGLAGIAVGIWTIVATFVL